jgi:hypothetical protein
MKKLLQISLTLFFTTILSSQIRLGDTNQKIKPEFCTQKLSHATPTSSGRPVDINAHYCFRIYLHVITKNDGTGGLTDPEVYAAIDTLKAKFEPFNINFKIEGDIHKIEKSLEHASPQLSLLNTYNHTDGIDIIFAPSIDLNYLNGDNHIAAAAEGGERAGTIDSTGILIGGKLTNRPNPNNYTYSHIPVAISPVIAHEVGHVLMLKHPHDGTTELFAPTCSDLTINPDGVDDTPYDPGAEYWDVNPANGIWDGTVNGTIRHRNCTRPNVNPDVTNIMSYGPPNQLRAFTAGQEYRMKDFIQNINNFSAHLTTDYVRIDCDHDNSFPKVYENTNYKYSKLWSDNAGNIYLQGGVASNQSPLPIDIDGVVVNSTNFLAKYKENGNLVWVKEQDYSSLNLNLKFDTNNNNNIYSQSRRDSHSDENKIMKRNQNYEFQWEYSFRTRNLLDYEVISNNKIIALTKDVITKEVYINTINSITGSLESTQNILNSENLDNLSLNSSNDGKDIYVTSNFKQGNFVFGGSNITHDGLYDGDELLLKYTNNRGTYIPVTFNYLNLGYHGNIFLNRSTENLFFISENKYHIFNSDLTEVNSDFLPNHSTHFTYSSMFNQRNNTFINIDSYGNLNKMVDDGNFNFTSIDTGILSYSGSSIRLNSSVLSDNGLVFVSGTSTSSTNSTHLLKIDSLTGEFLSKNTKQNKTIEIKEPNSITISPNPFKESFKITFKEDKQQTIFLLDNFGKVFFTKKIKGATYTLPNLNLKKGIYFLKCIDQDGNVLVKQIIKN